MKKVVIVGSGSWGTAVSKIIAVNTQEVVIFARSEEVAHAINLSHKNPRHLKDCLLPSNVSASTDPTFTFKEASAVLFATPSRYLRATAKKLAAFIAQDTPVCVLTKGIEQTSGDLMSEVVGQELGNPSRISVLSGPNHAEEVGNLMISASVVASANPSQATFFQALFSCPSFRVYVSDDIVGVQICGAVKNVVALAVGVAKGLGAGDNTIAVLMTRGLAEIGRIVVASKAQALTCMGLAGMGDLVATCSSAHSRNRSFGEAFVAHESLEEYEKRTGMVVEGALAVRSALHKAQSLGVECPLTQAVYAILYEEAPLDDAIDMLLGRKAQKEFYGYK